MSKQIIITLGIIAAIIVFNHPAFGRLPKGERLARIEKSEHYRD